MLQGKKMTHPQNILYPLPPPHAPLPNPNDNLLSEWLIYLDSSTMETDSLVLDDVSIMSQTQTDAAG